MIELAKNIEAIRLAKGIKQLEMGRRLGVSQTAYSNYVNRDADIPFGRVERIAEALGVTVVDLITWPDHYVSENSVMPECEECKQKQKTIDNLNLLIDVLNNKLKRKV